MRVIALRLRPGEDLRGGIEAAFGANGAAAGCVLASVGSLSVAALRLAGQEAATVLAGDLEMVALSGTLSPDGAHLHLAVADATGRMTGGHLLHGSVVRTTAELVLGLPEGMRFAREVDPQTGWRELVVRPEG